MTSSLSRRTFLQGASSASLTSLLTEMPTVARAENRVPSSVATGFNGGRSQVNLNYLQIGGDYPFLNCLKNAQSWSLLDNSGPPEPDTLDSDGYPLVIVRGGVYTVFDVPSQAQRPGHYVISWNGNGTVFCGMTNTPISGSKTSTSGSGRYVFSTSATRFAIGISSIGSPRVSNLQVFHVDDEAALGAGQVFGVQFKRRLVEANFGVIRFLNWQNGNTTNVTAWATRKPLSYVFYAGSEFRRSLYAGLTNKSGAAYSVTLPGFKLIDKATVLVRFNASCSEHCTLNVSETGNINILSAYSTPLSSLHYPIGGTWQSIATLVYDAGLDAWIKQGGDAALGSIGLQNGCPPELMVRLCAEIGAHPYFVTPPLAIDPATDYMPSLAAYCQANCPSWMIPRFEGPNELWNNASGFYQTHYARAKAVSYGWGPDVHNWYGKVMSVLGQAVSKEYGGDRSKYQVLCGVQTGTGATVVATESSSPRLTSTKYLAQNAPSQELYTKSPASSWVTHICCAQYYVPSDYNTDRELRATDAYAALAGNPQQQMSIAEEYAKTANGSGGNFTLTKCLALYANWKAWALRHGIRNMCGYEGGYSPDYTSLGKSKVDALRSASKLAPVLSDFTTYNYMSFVGLTSDGFTAEFPSCFQLSGRAPSNNVWSLLEDIYCPSPPQWMAIVAFNKGGSR